MNPIKVGYFGKISKFTYHQKNRKSGDIAASDCGGRGRPSVVVREIMGKKCDPNV